MAKEDPKASGPAAGPAVATAAEKPKGGEIKKYFCGLTDECPFDYITIPTFPKDGGAFTFQKRTQKQIPSGDGMLALSGPQPGGMLEMFEDEYAKVLEYVEGRGIIWNVKSQEEKRPEIVPLSSSQARNRRDVISGSVEPLSKYVYCVPSKSMTMDDREEGIRPKTVLELKDAEKLSPAGAPK